MSLGKESISRVNKLIQNENEEKKIVNPLNTTLNTQSDIIAIDKLVPVPKDWNFFKIDFNKLEYIKDSIKKYGVLQPIVVRYIEHEKYQVLSGYTRIKACKELGLKKIKAEILYNIDDNSAKDLILQLNFSQRELSYFEKRMFLINNINKKELPDYLL